MSYHEEYNGEFKYYEGIISDYLERGARVIEFHKDKDPSIIYRSIHQLCVDEGYRITAIDYNAYGHSYGRVIEFTLHKIPYDLPESGRFQMQPYNQ